MPTASVRTKPRVKGGTKPIESPTPTSKAASTAANARWASEKTTEAELREHFRKEPIPDCLALLGKMRQNCEIAAFEINQRMTETDQTKCKGCGRPKPPNRQWRLIRPRTDAATGTHYNEFFCSDACVALENQKNQGAVAR